MQRSYLKMDTKGLGYFKGEASSRSRQIFRESTENKRASFGMVMSYTVQGFELHFHCVHAGCAFVPV